MMIVELTSKEYIALGKTLASKIEESYNYLVECCQHCSSKDIAQDNCYNGKPCFKCPKYRNSVVSELLS